MNYTTHILKADSQADKDHAIALLSEGHLVALPTETVYGLAADARNPHAVNKIFTAKNRPSSHPLIVHIAGIDKVHEWAQDVSDDALKLAHAFWPGPLTLLFKKASAVNTVVTGGHDTIAVRVPVHPVFQEILQKMNTGLAAPSANPHKKISPTTAQHVIAGLSGKIAAVLDGGPCAIGVESTIVDVTSKTISILRPGPISKFMIEDVLKKPVKTPYKHDLAVPGNMAIHYRPETQSFLMDQSTFLYIITLPEYKDKTWAYMHYSPFTHDYKNVKTYSMPCNKELYTQKLYHVLHELDSYKVDYIVIELPPADEAWSDVHDRLSKAATLYTL